MFRNPSTLAVLLVLVAACGGDDDGGADAGDDDQADAASAGPDLWDGWTARRAAIHDHPNGVASDPTVLKTDDGYAMYYTCINAVSGRTEICGATSTDGVTWARILEGAALVQGTPATPFARLEGVFGVIKDDEMKLYLSGYPDEPDPLAGVGFPASLFLTSAADGASFPLEAGHEIMAPTIAGRDGDAVYSPSIVADGSEQFMAYTGHCWNECDLGFGATILAARSTDGVVWERQEGVLLAPDPDVPWMAETVAEVALVEADGEFYLFFTGFAAGGQEMAIGVARAPALEGPYEVRPEPIISADDVDFAAGQVLAPAVLLEGDKARMWFMGIDGEFAYRIGLAEAS